MAELVEFANAFMSYVMVALIIVVVAGAGGVVGVSLAKRKAAKKAADKGNE